MDSRTDRRSRGVRTPLVHYQCEGCGEFFALVQDGQACCSARCRRRKSRNRRRERIEQLVAESQAALERLAKAAVRPE